MTTVEALVQGYYGRPDLLQRIEAALRKAGVDPQKLDFRDLHPFDQLHGLGILATEEHAARAGVRAGIQVLDLGCGLGGSSRYLAAVCGCRVSAIDLTSEFVELARVLPRAAVSQTVSTTARPARSPYPLRARALTMCGAITSR